MLATRSQQHSSGAASNDHRVAYPCSQAQQRFWFEEQLHPHNPGLNVAVRWRLDGDLSSATIEQAWQFLIARHESLRTRLETVDGEPIAIVEPRIRFSMPVYDLRGLSESDAAREAEELAVAEARTPFALDVAPLVRVSRIVLGDTRSVLLVTAHHTICDGWSVGILAREMGQICAMLQQEQPISLPELTMTYRRFAEAERTWLRDGSFEEEIARSREALRDYKQFELLTDRPRLPVQTSNGKIATRLLDRALTDALSDISRRNGSTLFMTSLAALLTVLHRYTGESDITIGTQVVGRDEVDLEGVIGCFINTVALRGDLSGDPTFEELVERTRDVVTDTFDLRHFPLERLIEVVNPKRDLSRNALFSINFIFQRSFIADTPYDRFELTDMPSRSAGSLFDLNFFMVERPTGWRFSCEYNTDLFEDDTVERLMERFHTLLGAAIATPGERISRLPMVSADERRQLVIVANETTTPYPADQTVPELFTMQAERTPCAVAVTSGAATLTYAELENASNRLARELTARGLGAGERVGILLDRSTDLIVALLAVLKSGSAYIPLDPTYPRERLEYILESSHPALVITTSAIAGQLGTSTIPVLRTDGDAGAIAGNDGSPLPISAQPADIAYVIYTSGSTGKPKGVQIEHRSLVNLLHAMSIEPGMSTSDVLVAVTTISFDIAALEMFLPLVSGGQLVIAPESDVIDGAALLALVRRSGATIVQATPITWQLLLDAGWRGDPALKMLCGGESLPRRLANALLAGGGELWNMYGPTESTIWSSALRVERGDGPVPIGPPIANTQFYVLDAYGELVPPGVPGELYIGGDGVARGYFERPDLTAERFVPDRFAAHGGRLYRTGDFVRRRGPHTFEFLGRADQQIKLRGYRIELGEIEAALLRDPEVAEAVLVVRDDDGADKALWAFVVPTDGKPPHEGWTSTLRERLSRSLPVYMLPAPIVALDRLPRTPNGKIDRNALPKSVVSGTETFGQPPVTPVEIKLAAIIGGLLRRENVARHDDIFALGFHSLLAMRLLNQISKSFGVQLPLRALFDAQTIEQLATRIEALPSSVVALERHHSIVTLNPHGSRPAFAFLHSDVLADGMYCRRLAAVAGPAQPIVAIAPHGTAGLPLVPTVEAMAQDYLPRLRALQPRGPYRLGGFCAGGLVAYELARLLREQGEIVDRLVLINASAPTNEAANECDRIIRAIGLDARLDPRLRESLCYNVARLYEASADGPLSLAAFIGRRLRALFARAERDTRSGMADFEPFEKRRGTRETENYFAHLVAALTYCPKPYDGDLTLIWGMDQTSMADPTVGWASLARSVHVAPMAGGHVSPLHDRIEELGRVLGGLLR